MLQADYLRSFQVLRGCRKHSPNACTATLLSSLKPLGKHGASVWIASRWQSAHLLSDSSAQNQGIVLWRACSSKLHISGTPSIFPSRDLTQVRPVLGAAMSQPDCLQVPASGVQVAGALSSSALPGNASAEGTASMKLPSSWGGRLRYKDPAFSPQCRRF